MAVARAAAEREVGTAGAGRLATAVGLARSEILSQCVGPTTSVRVPQHSELSRELASNITGNTSVNDAMSSINPWMSVLDTDIVAVPQASARPSAMEIKVPLFRPLTTSKTSASIQCIDIDPIEDRFLIFCDAVGGVGLVDCAVWEGKPLTAEVYTDVSASLSSPSLSSPPLSSPALAAHLAGKPITCIRWYPVDSGLFVTSGVDGKVVVWDTNRKVPGFVFNMPAQVFCCAFSPIATSHTLLAAGNSEGAIHLVDLRACAATHTLSHTSSAVASQHITCVEWSPWDEYHLLSGSADGTIRVWDCRRSGASAQLAVLDDSRVGSLATGVSTSHPGLSYQSKPVVSHAGGVLSMAFASVPTYHSHDSIDSQLVSFGKDGAVRSWQLRTTRSDGTTRLQFANSLTSFPNARSDKRRCFFPCVFDVGRAATDALIAYPGKPTKTRGSAFVSSIAGSGGLVESAAPSNAVLLANAATGEQVGELSGGHVGGINALAFRSTTQQLLSAGEDGTVLLWDAPLLRSGLKRPMHTPME